MPIRKTDSTTVLAERKVSVGMGFSHTLKQNTRKKVPSVTNARFFLLTRKRQITICKRKETNTGGYQVAILRRSSSFLFAMKFAAEEYAMSAIMSIDSPLLHGKKICAAKFMRKSDRLPVNKEHDFTNVYIKNIDDDISENVSLNKFSEFGKVAIMKDDPGELRGFCFISFESPKDANETISSIHGAQLESKKNFAAEAQKDVKKHLKKLEGSIDYMDLRSRNGISRGLRFVLFSTAEESNEAIAKLQRTTFKGKLLYKAIAQHKEVRLAKSDFRSSLRYESVSENHIPMGTKNWSGRLPLLSRALRTGTWTRAFGSSYRQKVKHFEQHACEGSKFHYTCTKAEASTKLKQMTGTSCDAHDTAETLRLVTLKLQKQSCIGWEERKFKC